MNKLINIGEVSRTLCNDRSSVTSKRIPKTHEKAVKELETFCEKWKKKYSKKIIKK